MKYHSPPKISVNAEKTGRGGAREGAGRKKGGSNRRTREQIEKALKGGKKMPLDYMLAVMRDPKASLQRRDEMARAAARFCHPILQAVQHAGSPDNPVIFQMINRPPKEKR
jgi:hypothetical protein